MPDDGGGAQAAGRGARGERLGQQARGGQRVVRGLRGRYRRAGEDVLHLQVPVCTGGRLSGKGGTNTWMV